MRLETDASFRGSENASHFVENLCEKKAGSSAKEPNLK